MKKLLLCGLVLLAGASTAYAQLTPTGGPDQYGYTWRTSAAANGPTYRWIDIRARGNRVLDLDDDNLAPTPLALPFDFEFYLRSYNQVRVASNGYLAFTYPGGPAPASLSQPFPVMPLATDQQRAFVAGYLADFNFSTAGINAANPGQCYYMVNNDSLVVSYINAPFWYRAAAGQPDFRGANTFQIILSRLDSSVTYQYQTLDPAPPPPATGSPNSYLVGMEDLTGTLGLQAGLNDLPANGSAIKFYRPRVSTLQFTDVAANGFGNADNAATFEVLNRPFPVVASVSNSGNTNVGAFNTTVRILNQRGVGTPLYTQTVPVASLRAQRDTLITLPMQYTSTAASPNGGRGVFQTRTAVQLTGDQNAFNNTRSGMFVVVDTTNVPEVILSYDDEVPNQAAGFAVGVYFKPPFYPVDLRTTEAQVLGQGAATESIKIKVYADNGPNGTPGTLLAEDSIAQADVTIGALNTFYFNQRPVITTGGFYISWVIDSLQSMTIATHGGTATTPVSGRNYEVINGTFAPYRVANENVLITATIGTRMALGRGEDRTGQLALAPAYPNPAADRTTIGFSLRRPAPVTLVVRDLLGRAVRTVELGTPTAGEHRYDLSTADLAPGLYTYSLRTGAVQLTRKLQVNR